MSFLIVKMFVLLLFSLFALSEQCCQPAQWEGIYQYVIGSDTPTPSLNKVTCQFSYDSNRKMINLNGTGEYNGTPYVFRNIQDYENNAMYQISNGQCTKSGAPGPFIERCMNDTNVRHGFIGVGSSRKAVHIYEVKYSTFTADVSVDDDCLVIDSVAYNDNMLKAARATDITIGIKDVSVFEIPDICKQDPGLLG